MKITSKNDISKYINETSATRTQKPGKKGSLQSNAPSRSKGEPTVSLSETSKDVLKAHQAMQSEPDIRLEKVRDLKEKIKNKTYEIDYDGTSEKMLKAFSDET